MMAGSVQHTFDTLKQIIYDIELACRKRLGIVYVVSKVKALILSLAFEIWSILSDEQKALMYTNHFLVACSVWLV